MRDFCLPEHLCTLAARPVIQLRDGRGVDLHGVTGRPGPRAVSFLGVPIGLDEITMIPGTQFDLHEHEGDHVLYVLEGCGGIFIDGQLHRLAPGDSIFVPAECPHGVTTLEEADSNFRFLSFGIPHHTLDDDSRMSLVDLQGA